MKRIFALNIIILTVVITMFSGSIISCGVETANQRISAQPYISAKGAVLMDARSGEILYQKNMDNIFEPASTTKIMTAMLVVENLSPDTVVTIDASSQAEGSKLNLQAGEKISVRELLYGLLLKSANDCAVALAHEVAGDTESFVAMMNKKAVELGCKNTNFKNPNGLHLDGHYTSPHDLAIIGAAAMRDDIIRSYVTTPAHTIPATNMSPARNLKNSNHLLFDTDRKVNVNGIERPVKYEGANGLKTGYTPQAGHCIVATAARGEKEYIVAVMSTSRDGRYADPIALLDWGFDNFYPVKIMSAGEGAFVSVKMGRKEKIKAIIDEDVYVTLPKGADSKKILFSIKSKDNLEAPIEQNDKIGNLEIYYGDTMVKKIPAYAKENCERGGIISFLRSLFILQTLMLAVTALLIFTLARLYNIRQKRIKEKKEEERKRRAAKLELQRVEENMRKFSRYR